MKKLQVEKISEYFPLDKRKDQEGKRKKKENENKLENEVNIMIKTLYDPEVEKRGIEKGIEQGIEQG